MLHPRFCATVAVLFVCATACVESNLDRRLKSIQHQAHRSDSKSQNSQPTASAPTNPPVSALPPPSASAPQKPLASLLTKWPSGTKQVNEGEAEELTKSLGLTVAATALEVRVDDVQMDGDPEKERVFHLIKTDAAIETHHIVLVKAGRPVHVIGPLEEANFTVSKTQVRVDILDTYGDGVSDVVIVQTEVQFGSNFQGGIASSTSAKFQVWTMRQGKVTQSLKSEIGTGDADAASFPELIHLEREGTSKLLARFGEQGTGVVLGTFSRVDGSSTFEQVQIPKNAKQPGSGGVTPPKK